ncbi:hypothetical protein D915_010823 [Fasciola hepatica]|uniref:G-protein coupled receptors family 1 profile domain-containing protein n=1 Tax=Fasciola hepatica TaxID=6192 RepID=A0A4E0QY44_FASHE|nr:hypothetical protein D915_010823 [Fasciola hepatica]
MNNSAASESSSVIQMKNWSLANNGLLWVMYIILLVTVFVGNTLVITTVVTCKRFRGTFDCFVASLALADLLMIFGPIPGASLFAYYGYWPFEHPKSCAVWIGSITFLGSASMYNLASISVDRLVACTHPLRYRTTFSKARVALCITISWTVPFIVVLASFASGGTSVSDGSECFDRLELHVRVRNLSIGFIIPWTVVIGSNMFIIRVLHIRSQRNIGRRHTATRVSFNPNQRGNSNGQRKNPYTPQSCPSKTNSNLTRFQLSLPDGSCLRSVNLVPRWKATAFQFILDMSAGKYPSRIRLSMTRELMEICFAKYVPHDHLQKELFLHVTRNRGRNSRMHRMIADANPKPESLKPSDARGLSEDAYTTKPENSEGTCSVQPRFIQAQQTVPETSSSNRCRVVLCGLPSERGMLVSMRSYMIQRPNRIMLVVIICFFICWTPIMMSYFIEAVRGVSYSPLLRGILFWIAFANSACNPIVYVLLNKRYGEAFKNILCQSCHT